MIDRQMKTERETMAQTGHRDRERERSREREKDMDKQIAINGERDKQIEIQI